MDELEREGYQFESHRVDAGGVLQAWAVAVLVLVVVLLACWWGIG